jgi:hypothetical protein
MSELYPVKNMVSEIKAEKMHACTCFVEKCYSHGNCSAEKCKKADEG